MMRTIIFSSLLLIFSVNVLTAQDSLATSNFIEDEFDNLIESSNNYQGYKVVDYDALIELRDNTKRHVQDLKNELQEEQSTIASQNEEIENLENQLAETQEDLKRVNEEKDAIRFLGMPFSKGSYMAMMWGIVGVLILALLFFIYKFKNSNATTKEARHRLNETEKEFDAYRAKALEKEQRLGRMLQDEKNKAKE
jgi:septal ring factor EnvC (AmiA/AmiB activator)